MISYKTLSVTHDFLMLNSASPSVLGRLCPNQHFSNAVLEVPDGVHSKCADYKILVSENLTTLTTTSHIETFPFSKIMTAMDCILLVGPEAKPLRWLLWHCHTTSNDAIHLPLGKCNVKSDKIQTFHDFREKHNVSKHGQIWTRELCRFSQAILKMQI